MTDSVPPTVLIVEGSATTRQILEYSFTAEGFLPLSVGSAQEAVFQMRTLLPHIAVIDVQLPDAKGLDIVRAMREQEALRGVPVLMLAANSEERASLESGPRPYEAVFEKPFSIKKLVQTARGLVSG